MVSHEGHEPRVLNNVTQCASAIKRVKPSFDDLGGVPDVVEHSGRR
jgi:hypothetical protein